MLITTMTEWSRASSRLLMDSSWVKAHSLLGIFLNRISLASEREQNTVFTVEEAVSLVISYIRVHSLYEPVTGIIVEDLTLENACQLRMFHACQVRDIVSFFTQTGWFERVGRMSMMVRRGSLLDETPADVQRYFLPENLTSLLFRSDLMPAENSRKSFRLSTLQELVAWYVIP